MVFSQVVLSLQLPFAVVPLVRFTASRKLLGALASPRRLTALGWLAPALIVALNLWLAAQSLAGLAAGAATRLGIAALASGDCVLLGWVAFAPLGRRPAPGGRCPAKRIHFYVEDPLRPRGCEGHNCG